MRVLKVFRVQLEQPVQQDPLGQPVPLVQRDRRALRVQPVHKAYKARWAPPAPAERLVQREQQVERERQALPEQLAQLVPRAHKV
jgi:hypothetical protein